MKLEPFLTPYTKINSKWIKYLKIKYLNILYNPPHRVMGIQTKVNKWDLIKLKSFGTAKETISKVKRQPSEWEKIIANETTDP